MRRNFLPFRIYVNYYHLYRTCRKNISNIEKNVHIKEDGGENKLKVDNNIINGVKHCTKEKDIRVNKIHADYVEIDGDIVTRKDVSPADDLTSCKKIKFRSLKNFNLLAGCLITSLFFYFTLKKVPEGYICLIENKTDGTVLPYIYDDLMTFFFNPLKYRIILMRVIPIQKKYIHVYETLDKKKIKVKLEVKMKPKIPFVVDIYSSFGANYSSAYVEREMSLDIENVIKNYNLDTLLQTCEKSCDTQATTVDDVVDQIMDRFYDCSVFHKITLLDVSILFEEVK
ncbi:prohibitin-like protein PHBL [Plasmodium brasilianum]|uniref:Prohibitin-like protein, putative n=2 Tax=Plasmodium (Plasmodium) TaxID=418103 RepID=A0A1A8X4Q0_PLAMA|nr:prohibitin-like protein, putative [Plasmodium malariae]KAI4840116.1 prohibitin-like protein PHBL [Plasmodium brasilianum]SBT00246.1 prohibitin-like protein, putative [Plasmodium malariae]SBT87479.1 prohibitin-like protein, putative [Plasmodium malariae]